MTKNQEATYQHQVAAEILRNCSRRNPNANLAQDLLLEFSKAAEAIVSALDADEESMIDTIKYIASFYIIPKQPPETPIQKLTRLLDSLTTYATKHDIPDSLAKELSERIEEFLHN